MPARFACHVVAASGTRLEETEKIFSAVEAEGAEDHSRRRPGHDHRQSRCAFGAVYMAFGTSATLGTQDGEILIALKHEPPQGRARLHRRFAPRNLRSVFPNLTFYFQPADNRQPES